MFFQDKTLDQLHTFLDILTPIAGGAVSLAGYMLHSKLGEMQLKTEKAAVELRAATEKAAAELKATTEKSAAELKETMVAHTTKVAIDLAVHQAEDRGEFRELKAGQADARSAITEVRNGIQRIEDRQKKNGA